MEACWIYERNNKSTHVVEAYEHKVNTLFLIKEFRHFLNSEPHDLPAAFALLKKFNRLLIKSHNQAVKLNIETNTDEVKVSINDFEINTSLTHSHLFAQRLSDNFSTTYSQLSVTMT